MRFLIAIIFMITLTLAIFSQPVLAADGDPCQSQSYQQNSGSKADNQNPLGKIERPCFLLPIGAGVTGINYVINIFIKVIYSLAGIALLIMIVWGAFNWITSGGNKESLQAAQKRIVSAITGAIVLALAAPLTNFIMEILGLGKLFG